MQRLNSNYFESSLASLLTCLLAAVLLRCSYFKELTATDQHTKCQTAICSLQEVWKATFEGVLDQSIEVFPCPA